MTIEENIFKHAEISKNALAGYGFRQAKGLWILERPFMNGDFKAVIRVDSAGNVSGTVYEIVTEDEYLPLRVESMDGFAAEVRNAYIESLKKGKPQKFKETSFEQLESGVVRITIRKQYNNNNFPE